MHKKTVKIINIILILIYIITFSTIVYGEEINPIDVVGSGTNVSKGNGVDTLYEMGNAILGIIQYIGVGVAVIATLVLAMKYMYSSPEDKAEVKKKLIPYIIGGVLVFGAVQLVKIVETFAGELVKIS